MIEKWFQSWLNSPWRRYNWQTRATLVVPPTPFPLLPTLLRCPMPYHFCAPALPGFHSWSICCAQVPFTCSWVNTGISLMMRISTLSQAAPLIAGEHTLFPSPAQDWGLSVLSLRSSSYFSFQGILRGSNCPSHWAAIRRLEKVTV